MVGPWVGLRWRGRRKKLSWLMAMPPLARGMLPLAHEMPPLVWETPLLARGIPLLPSLNLLARKMPPLPPLPPPLAREVETVSTEP